MTKKIAEISWNTQNIRIEAIAWEVPKTKRYPNGIKYSFQALDKNKNHLERWDNSTDAHGPIHHKHLRDGSVGEIHPPPNNKDQIKNLPRDFINEMETKYG